MLIHFTLFLAVAAPGQTPVAKVAPVCADVVAGTALNELLTDIAAFRAKGAVAEGDAISPQTLARLNTMPEKSAAGNPALLRDDAKVTWPKALAELPPAEDTADARRRVEKFLAAARAQVKDGPISANVARDLKDAVADLEKWFAKRIVDAPQADHAAGKRYLKLLSDAAEAATWPDVKEYRPGGTQAAKGADAVALAELLRARKLRFAPAGPGDEPAYAAAHVALEKYRAALRVAAR